MNSIDKIFGNSLFDKLFNYAHLNGLEIHVSNQETRTRIVLILPNGCTYSNGSSANREIAEAEGSDHFECIINLFERLEEREYMAKETLKQRRTDENIEDCKAC